MDYLKTMTEEELDEYADTIVLDIEDLNEKIHRLDAERNFLHERREALKEIIDKIDGFVE